MAARKRDYKAEYRRRLELGRLRGETVKQARGHRGDLTRAERAAGGRPGVVLKRDLSGDAVMEQLSLLSRSRRAMVIAHREDGTQQIVAGKKGGQDPRRLREYIEDEEGLDEMADEDDRYGDHGAVVSYSVVWS